MADLLQYKQLIVNNFPRLTKNQKRIAQYFIDHPEEFAFSSIDTIANKLNVGKSTIVRLAKALGYDGFLELKIELSNKLRDDFSQTKKFTDTLKNQSTRVDFISILSNNEARNIQSTIQKIDKNMFNEAIKIFIAAPNIYTLGSGISRFLSEIAAYYFNRMNMKTKAFTHGSVSFEEQIISLKKDDAILIISLPPYTYSNIEAAEAARYRGVKVISITDQITSPISQYSDVVFVCDTENIVFINTVCSILSLIYVLATGIGLSDRTTSLTSLSLLEKVESEYGFDIHAEFFE
ncbi:MAG TPA: MurR/RpiR family transcriptional regulator [Ignavibacteriales bacterium]|nr:MurR/RpiR family transcriptional regulator [Ignavibacteriales bacterium]HEX3073442.1 MurR/RpiR family transcriptional regulator [Ignavibacteriales bacterium]